MSGDKLPGNPSAGCISKTTSPGRAVHPILESYVVEKCANPSCSARFRRLRDGRLFVMEAVVNDRPRQLRYLWLCDSCRRTLTVAKKGNEAVVASLFVAKAAS
jgi:hypothetical protein